MIFHGRLFIKLSLLFGFVTTFYIRYGDRENVLFFTKEDSLVENLSAIFYLVGYSSVLSQSLEKNTYFWPSFGQYYVYYFLVKKQAGFKDNLNIRCLSSNSTVYNTSLIYIIWLCLGIID